MDRVNEISFNSSLMREMRAIAGVTRLIEAGTIGGARYERIYFHRIADEEAMAGLGAKSKLGAKSTLDLDAW